jgi:hypothetical protein
MFLFLILSSLVYPSFSFLGWGETWVHLVNRPLTGLLYQPRMIDDESGAVGRMEIGWGNRSTRRKPAPLPLCPPQIPHDLIWAWNRAAALGSRRQTAWFMAQPFVYPFNSLRNLVPAAWILFPISLLLIYASHPYKNVGLWNCNCVSFRVFPHITLRNVSHIARQRCSLFSTFLFYAQDILHTKCWKQGSCYNTRTGASYTICSPKRYSHKMWPSVKVSGKVAVCHQRC